jgi:hypothetical protein
MSQRMNLKILSVLLASVWSMQAVHADTSMLPPPDPSYRFKSTRYDLSAADDALFHKADKYADSPQVDADGVRHFGNGRHFDLSKTSLNDAISQTNTSTLGGKKKPINPNNFDNSFRNNTANNFGNNPANSYGNGFRNNAANNSGNSFRNGGNHFDNGYRNNASFDSGYGNTANNGGNYYRNNNNNYYRNQPAPYIQDWSNSQVATLNNQNYNQQTAYWNQNYQYRNQNNQFGNQNSQFGNPNNQFRHRRHRNRNPLW